MSGVEAPAVSVVIPVYRDEAALGRLLSGLSGLLPRPREILVADGGASGRCRTLCRRYGAIYLSSFPCRGLQLNTGARRASGEVLWFLHADATLPEDPLSAIGAALAKDACGGFFRFRFDGSRPWPAPLLERMVEFRVRSGGIPYGDQGLFMTRDAYWRSGGYPPWPLFEEVPLVRNLRTLAPFVALEEAIGVDPRRWERDGWWRRSLANRWLATKFWLGIPPGTLSERYRIPEKQHGTKREESQ